MFYLNSFWKLRFFRKNHENSKYIPTQSATETAAVGNLAKRLAFLAAYNDLTHNEISTRAIDLLKKRENGEIRLDNGLTAALIKARFFEFRFLFFDIIAIF